MNTSTVNTVSNLENRRQKALKRLQSQLSAGFHLKGGESTGRPLTDADKARITKEIGNIKNKLKV